MRRPRFVGTDASSPGSSTRGWGPRIRRYATGPPGSSGHGVGVVGTRRRRRRDAARAIGTRPGPSVDRVRAPRRPVALHYVAVGYVAAARSGRRDHRYALASSGRVPGPTVAVASSVGQCIVTGDGGRGHRRRPVRRRRRVGYAYRWSVRSRITIVNGCGYITARRGGNEYPAREEAFTGWESPGTTWGMIWSRSPVMAYPAPPEAVISGQGVSGCPALLRPPPIAGHPQFWFPADVRTVDARTRRREAHTRRRRSTHRRSTRHRSIRRRP